MRAAEQQGSAGKRFWVSGCLLSASLLGVAGCGDSDSGNLLGTSEGAQFQESTCAAELERLYPGVEILVIEREREGGKDVWGVELSNGKEVEFDAADCSVLEEEDADDDENDD